MKAQLVFKGQASKQVHVAEITDTDTDEAVLDLALSVSHETRDRLFNWTVRRYTVDITGETRAVVALYTD